jgi:hypothetical protein
MTSFECNPAIELSGVTANSLMINLMSDEMRPILERHNLADIDENAWYPLQNLLNVLRDIAASQGGSLNLVSIGMSAAKQGLRHFPPPVFEMSLLEFFSSYQQWYDARHRPVGEGRISAEEVEAGHITITLQDIPYPDDVMYGLFYELVRSLRPAGTNFTLEYDDEVQRDKTGGNATRLHLWLDAV